MGLLGNKDFANLNDRLYIGVIGHVALQHSGMITAMKSSAEVNRKWHITI